jgi:hypothetical protein
MDRWRPFYKLASFIVHAFTKGLIFKLGLIQNGYGPEVLWVGASNYGLADPAQNAAISLHQIITHLITTKPSIERLIAMNMMQKMAAEIENAFCNSQRDIE